MLGAENKKVMFLFTDAHVADEGFLELINNMLTSGMVPALYDDSEKDALVNRWAACCGPVALRIALAWRPRCTTTARGTPLSTGGLLAVGLMLCALRHMDIGWACRVGVLCLPTDPPCCPASFPLGMHACVLTYADT